VRVVWASDRTWALQGGAEFADKAMISRKPADVDVYMLAPGFADVGNSVEALLQADRVVVTGVHRFSEREIGIIAMKRPVVWAHDVDTLGHPLHGLASDLICGSPLHQTIEEAGLHRSGAWAGPRVHLCPGWFDTSLWDDPVYDVPAEKREKRALWAHRPVWSKNLLGAQAWCQERKIPLHVMMARPREEVLAKMAEVRYFVLLSHIVDPAPWAVIEAQLSGCEVIVNELVGWYGMPREDLRTAIDHQDAVFWGIVRGEE
jgi:hypothetical protein